MRESINISEWFNGNPKDVEVGIELELMLYNTETNKPLSDSSLTESVLTKLPHRIYKDYYPYQLEIRTTPHDNAEDIINETKALYRRASKAFSIYNVLVIPAPNISEDGYTDCGMHMHIHYPNLSIDNYWAKAMGMYPFVLSLADHTKNFEVSENNNSGRMKHSRHIELPYLEKERFLAGNHGDRKWKDIIYSPEVLEEETRSRLVKPSTIEVRIFDTPSLFRFYSFVVKFMVNLAKYISTRNPISQALKDGEFQNIRKAFALTRNCVIDDRYAVNKVFRMWNANVCEDISSQFDIDFPRQTQYEYREEKGISATTEGFLSMAIEGGWLD